MWCFPRSCRIPSLPDTAWETGRRNRQKKKSREQGLEYVIPMISEKNEGLSDGSRMRGNMRKGTLTIISGFSGAGKGTVMKALLAKYSSQYALSISATSRKPREGEVNGREYFFKTKEEFKYEFSRRIIESYGRTVEESHITEKFMTLERMVRDYASVNWAMTKMATKTNYQKQKILRDNLSKSSAFYISCVKFSSSIIKLIVSSMLISVVSTIFVLGKYSNTKFL